MEELCRPRSSGTRRASCSGRWPRRGRRLRSSPASIPARRGGMIQFYLILCPEVYYITTSHTLKCYNNAHTTCNILFPPPQVWPRPSPVLRDWLSVSRPRPRHPSRRWGQRPCPGGSSLELEWNLREGSFQALILSWQPPPHLLMCRKFNKQEHFQAMMKIGQQDCRSQYKACSE